MDHTDFWNIIEGARRSVANALDSEGVAAQATALLADRGGQEIAAAEQVLWDLMAESYRAPLWAAAYMINGGCSDDGFDYFRGWLMLQGRKVFEQAVAEPDSLAELIAVRNAAEEWSELECEDALGIASAAYRAATGGEPPSDSYSIRYPDLDPSWDFDFDDWDEVQRRLPRLGALYARHHEET